jgi:catechol 2,3-dioxygenase-like lactoylglutathione lyase family enzyme
MRTGLNHITIAVNDLEKSFRFYTELLGITPHAMWDKGAYLSLGELWFCLNIDKSSPAQDYTHIAFSIDSNDFEPMKLALREKGIKEWQKNHSEGNSLYLLDPDGHKLEIHVGDMKSRIASMKDEKYQSLKLL